MLYQNFNIIFQFYGDIWNTYPIEIKAYNDTSTKEGVLHWFGDRAGCNPKSQQKSGSPWLFDQMMQSSW